MYVFIFTILYYYVVINDDILIIFINACILLIIVYNIFIHSLNPVRTLFEPCSQHAYIYIYEFMIKFIYTRTLNNFTDRSTPHPD